MNREWKKLESKIVYENKWIKIYEDKVLRPDGKEGIYGYLDKTQSVHVIIFNQKERSVYLIKEYRYPIQKTIIDLPGGVVEDEDVLSAAKREVLEEVGIVAKNTILLGGFYDVPGHETTYANAVLVTEVDDSNLKLDGQEGDEVISEVFKVNIQEIKQMLLDGKIESGIAISALNLFFLYIEKNNI